MNQLEGILIYLFLFAICNLDKHQIIKFIVDGQFIQDCRQKAPIYAVYSGADEHIYLVKRQPGIGMPELKQSLLLLIKKPIDYYHQYRGVTKPPQSFIPTSMVKTYPFDIDAALKLPISSSPYWGFTSTLEQLRSWDKYQDQERPSTPNDNASIPLRYYSPVKNQIKSAFAVPLDSGFAYCASYSGPNYFNGLICFDEQGNIKNEEQHNQSSEIVAADIFTYSPKPMGIFFQKFNEAYWYQYFEVDYLPNGLITINRVSSWFFQSIPIDGCIHTFCLDLVIEKALFYNNSYVLGFDNKLMTLETLPSSANGFLGIDSTKGVLQGTSLTAVGPNVYYYQDSIIKVGDQGHQTFQMRPDLGHGTVDAAFTYTSSQLTRLFFLKDSTYLTVLWDANTTDHIVKDDKYDLRLLDPVLHGNWVPLISDFNTFTYLDAAIEFHRSNNNEIGFIYGNYLMIINNWTEDGHPISQDYPIELVASLFSCNFSLRDTPYTTHEQFQNILKSRIPKRFVIPPDEDLDRLFQVLGLAISSITATALVLCLIVTLCFSLYRKPVERKSKTIAIKMEDESSSSSIK